jgi:hypothetical protein
VPGVDVAETLQTDASRKRAQVILQAQPSRNLSDKELNALYAKEVTRIAKQGLPQREATKARMDAMQELVKPTQPVEQYIIPYYMPVKPGDKISEKLIKYFSTVKDDIVQSTDAHGKKVEKKHPLSVAKAQKSQRVTRLYHSTPTWCGRWRKLLPPLRPNCPVGLCLTGGRPG